MRERVLHVVKVGGAGWFSPGGGGGGGGGGGASAAAAAASDARAMCRVRSAQPTFTCHLPKPTLAWQQPSLCTAYRHDTTTTTPPAQPPPTGACSEVAGANITDFDLAVVRFVDSPKSCCQFCQASDELRRGCPQALSVNGLPAPVGLFPIGALLPPICDARLRSRLPADPPPLVPSVSTASLRTAGLFPARQPALPWLHVCQCHQGGPPAAWPPSTTTPSRPALWPP